MSQASNHIKWCINKAKKEIEVCEKEGKRKKHRGLLEIESNMEDARLHLEKAEHNLKAVISMNKTGFSDWSITASFYTFYQCFLAIASKFGYESANQSCTIALIEYLIEEKKIDMDIRYVNMLKYAEDENSIIDMREEYTYGIKINPENDEMIKKLIEDCTNILDITKTIIFS